MKKKHIFLIGLLSFLAILNAYICFGAFDEGILLGRSSFTTSNDTNLVIPGTPPGTVLWSVIVGTGTGGFVQIYDSSGSATNQIAKIAIPVGNAAVPQVFFEVKVSSGLTYTTTGNGVGVTIIFKRTRPSLYP